MTNHFNLSYSWTMYDCNTSNNPLFTKKEIWEYNYNGLIHTCPYYYYVDCMNKGINNLVPYTDPKGRRLIIFLDLNELEQFTKSNNDNKFKMLDIKTKKIYGKK